MRFDSNYTECLYISVQFLCRRGQKNPGARMRPGVLGFRVCDGGAPDEQNSRPPPQVSEDCAGICRISLVRPAGLGGETLARCHVTPVRDARLLSDSGKIKFAVQISILPSLRSIRAAHNGFTLLSVTLRIGRAAGVAFAPTLAGLRAAMRPLARHRFAPSSPARLFYALLLRTRPCRSTRRRSRR